MKKSALALLLPALLLTACREPAGTGQGTLGTSEVQQGTAHAAGGVPYGMGRLTPFQTSGFPDEAIAASQAEAGLGVSPEGDAELARRTESATIGSGTPPLATRPSTADQILLQKIQVALSSAYPQMAPLLEPYSIQTLNNIRITVNRGFVILRGQVPSYEDKRNIQLE